MMIEQLHRDQAQLFRGALPRWSSPAPDCLDAGESSRASVIIQSIKPEEEDLDSVRPAESVAGAGMSGVPRESRVTGCFPWPGGCRKGGRWRYPESPGACLKTHLRRQGHQGASPRFSRLPREGGFRGRYSPPRL